MEKARYSKVGTPLARYLLIMRTLLIRTLQEYKGLDKIKRKITDSRRPEFHNRRENERANGGLLSRRSSLSMPFISHEPRLSRWHIPARDFRFPYNHLKDTSLSAISTKFAYDSGVPCCTVSHLMQQGETSFLQRSQGTLVSVLHHNYAHMYGVLATLFAGCRRDH